MGIISPKLRASARGQLCMFQIPGVCNHDRETTVLCHLPSDVKGVGNKSDDFHAAFGCSACHEAIDQHWLPERDETFYSFRALQRTLRHWVQHGLIVIPVSAEPKHKPIPKVLPRKPSWRVNP